MIDKSFGRQIKEQKYIDREGAYLTCIENNTVAVVKNPLKDFFCLEAALIMVNHILNAYKENYWRKQAFCVKLIDIFVPPKNI